MNSSFLLIVSKVPRTLPATSFVCFANLQQRQDDEFKLGRTGGACEWSGQ